MHVLQMDDEALVLAATRGDRLAQAALARRLTMVMAGAARRFQRADTGIEDLVQEGWVELTRSRYAVLLAWRPDGGASLETYVARVAVRTWQDGQRSQARVKRGGRMARTEKDPDELMQDAQSPEAMVAARESAHRIYSALAEHLPPRGMLVLRLIFTDGLSVAEAAASIEVSEQVIYNWVYKIRTIAKDALERMQGGDDARRLSVR